MNRTEMAISIVLLFPFLAQEGYCQPIMGAAAIGIGSMTAYPDRGPWPVWNNPAHLEAVRPSAGFYGFQFAGIRELTDMAAVLATGAPGGSAGIGVHRYGFRLFHETRVRIAYRITNGPVRAGLAWTYLNLHQGEGYGSAQAGSTDLGVSITLYSGLSVSARLDNPARTRYGSKQNSIPHRISAGLSIHLSETTLSVIEWVREAPFPDSWRFGVETTPLFQLSFRGGIASEPDQWSFGFGYRQDRWSIHAAVQKHALLGFSPCLDITLKL